MSNADPEDPPDDACTLAVDAVLDVAAEHCGTEEAVMARLSRMTGVEPDVDCEAALREGVNMETCKNRRGLRQWIACRAHQLRRSDGVGLGTAMEQAWEEAEEECLTRGVEV